MLSTPPDVAMSVSAMSYVCMGIGGRIEQSRVNRRLSQADLAEAIGLGKGQQSRVSRWELDKGEPSYEHLVAIADATGVTLDFLLRGTDVPSEPVATPEEIVVLKMMRRLGLDPDEAIERLMRPPGPEIVVPPTPASHEVRRGTGTK